VLDHRASHRDIFLKAEGREYNKDMRVRVEVEYISKEVRLVFAEKVDHVGMDAETALKLANVLEEKARDLIGKVIVPVGGIRSV
jgi:hypothetical protein